MTRYAADAPTASARPSAPTAKPTIEAAFARGLPNIIDGWCSFSGRSLRDSSATELPPRPGPLCAFLSAPRSGPGLRPLRLLHDALGGSWRLWRSRGFQLRDPLGQRGDDTPVLPVCLPLLVQLRAEIGHLIGQDLDYRPTVYLSPTSALRPAFVHPHDHPPVVPVRPQRSPRRTLPHGLRARPEQLRRLPQVHPSSGHASPLRP